MSTREQIAERIREEHKKHPELDWPDIAAAKILSAMREERQPAQTEDKNARIYPCKDCGKMRSRAEGGTTFTVCDECWDKHFGLSQTGDLDAVATQYMKNLAGFGDHVEMHSMMLTPAHLAAFARSLAKPSAPTVEQVAHKWDQSGDRCEICGAKDWMGAGCVRPQDASIATTNTTRTR